MTPLCRPPRRGIRGRRREERNIFSLWVLLIFLPAPAADEVMTRNRAVGTPPPAMQSPPHILAHFFPKSASILSQT